MFQRCYDVPKSLNRPATRYELKKKLAFCICCNPFSSHFHNLTKIRKRILFEITQIKFEVQFENQILKPESVVLVMECGMVVLIMESTFFLNS